jgi:membrane fusion protein
VSATNLVQYGLFRPESVRARQLAWLGKPTVSLGFPTRLATAATIVLAAAVAALIAFGNYARRIDLHGLVLPNTGLIKISAPANGWIQSIAVRDGQEVQEGAVLYLVNVDTATSSGNTQQTIIRELNNERKLLADQIARKEQVRVRHNREIEQRVHNLRGQIDQTNLQITTQGSFEEILRKEYALKLDLLSRGTATRNDMSIRQQAWMSAKDRLEDLKTAALRLQAQLVDAEYQLATNDLQTGNDIGVLQTQISHLERQLASSEAQRSIEIRAPGPGTVTAVLGHPGQVVSAGSPMLTIVPRSTTMQAELLAASSAIGFIRPGERVLLRYRAFPYQKFGQYWGTVTDVSHAALPPEELKSVLTDKLESKATGPFYRIIVLPDRQNVTVYGKREPLPASMEVEAFVLLDDRPLYQWILEPLYGLRHSFQGA